MRCRLFWSTTLAFVLILSTLPSAQGISTTEEMIIEGAKTPEKFPEWFTWTKTFQRIASIKDTIAQGSEAASEFSLELGIPLAGLTALVHEGEVYRNKEAAALEKCEQVVKQLRAAKKTDEEILPDLQRIEMDLRSDALEGGDRVLGTLDATGKLNLRRWMEVRIIRATTVRLRGSEIARFPLPR